MVIILFPVLTAIMALAIDIGWVASVRNQLQVAADAGALAAAGVACGGQASAREAAQHFAGLNPAGRPSERAAVTDDDVVFGWWDTETRTFTPSGFEGNAMQVTVRKRLPLFVGPLLGVVHRDLQATAVALINPRDIVFVIDLSGSMNNDTEIWATNAINQAFPDQPGIGSDLVANVFEDFGFGSYPGVLRHVAQSLSGAPNNDTSYTWLANTYLLNNNSVPAKYKVLSADSSATRKTKAYSWIIDYQLAVIMPAAMPAPSSTSNLAYWTKYLDYIIKPRSGLPPNQDSFRISGAGNPYTDAWHDLTSASYSGYYNKLGYLTYVQFMMDHGRTSRPVSGMYVPLSRFSPACPWVLDNDPESPGYGLRFPPREQPTHAARLALMAALDRIAQINAGLAEDIKDHVSVITYDSATGCQILYPLSVSECDYQGAKNSIRTIQAAADDAANTASENGLVMARQHLDPATNPSGARVAASKLVIFLSDGIPNIKQSSNLTIGDFMSHHTDGEWFTSGDYRYERNAVLMQIGQMQAMGWRTFSVGIGLGADRSLMDRMARMAGTAVKDPSNPDAPKISAYAEGDPGNYQTLLTSIFDSFVSTPFIRLAK